MRREERVTVQGPVKEQQPDEMSHRGGKCLCVPPPPPRPFVRVQGAALHYACWYNHVATAQLLLDAGVSATAVIYGCSPGTPPSPPGGGDRNGLTGG